MKVKKQSKTKIVVMGLGYIGLPTAAMFAEKGFQVVGVDVKKDIVENINQGEIHIEEPGLRKLVSRNVEKGNLKAKFRPEGADVFVIAVPTPLTEEKHPHMKYVKEAIRTINPFLEKNNLVIIESTIAPCTTKEVVIPELKKTGLKIGSEVLVAHCPERVLPGMIIKELIQNNRVIGGIDKNSALRAAEIYRSFVAGEMYLTDVTTAEMVKLMENSFRDVNIALANEIAKIAGEIGIDVWEAIKLANKHPRVNYHLPGPGVGGHCLAVDPWFIVKKAPLQSRMIKLARNINDSMPSFVFNFVMEKLTNIKAPRVSILGISYKKNVDDIRRSPIIELIKIFRREGIALTVHDPYASNKIPDRIYRERSRVFNESDCLLLAVDHDVFSNLNPHEIAGKMRNKIIIDTRNFLNNKRWEQAGFSVFKLGNNSEFNWSKTVNEKKYYRKSI